MQVKFIDIDNVSNFLNLRCIQGGAYGHEKACWK